MGFLRRLLGGGGMPDRGSPEDTVAGSGGIDLSADQQLVVVWIRLADPDFRHDPEQLRVYGLEDRIMRTLFDSGAGDLDTNDLVGGYFAMRLVGPDAERILAIVSPLLVDPPRGSYLAVRRGPAGSSEERIDLG